MLWRRHARKRRAKATALFASAKRLDRPLGWRGRLVRFGERLFGHRRTHLARAQPHAPYAYAISKPMPMDELRVAEEAQHERDVDKLLDAYDYSRAGSSRGPSPLPSLHDYGHAPDTKRPLDAPHRLSAFSLSNESLYSHVTGQPRTGPQASTLSALADNTSRIIKHFRILAWRYIAGDRVRSEYQQTRENTRKQR